MTVVWRDIDGFDGIYQVSNEGFVRCCDRIKVIHCKNGVTVNRPIKGRVMAFYVLRGYAYVNLSKDGIQRTFLVHRLVADVFLNKDDGKDQVNHIDFNGCNNAVSNLEWTTRSENQKHSVRHGRGMYGTVGWDIQSRLRRSPSTVEENYNE